MEISVDCGKTLNTMRGGLGVSWHAMETLIPYGEKHPVFTSYSHGGSGLGGYPPAEDEPAWQQIYQHASWLGLDGNRVGIEQRVYEPERDQFTFDNPEMRILYRILDWNQKNGADVFFQQMWCNTAWLAYPEFRDDPVGRVHSAPNDLDAFANGLAALLEHLIEKRGYSCIKWLCINNEPGGGASRKRNTMPELRSNTPSRYAIAASFTGVSKQATAFLALRGGHCRHGQLPVGHAQHLPVRRVKCL